MPTAKDKKAAPAVDQDKLMQFMGKAVGDIGAAISAALVLIGDQLGLYKSLAQHGPMTPEELSKHTGTTERYIREWLNNQAAGGYVSYDPKSKKYSLLPEQAMALADEGSPVFLPGAFQVIAAAFKAQPKAVQNFKTGKGMEWGEHDPILFEGTERFFRPSYLGNLLTSWIPALEGMKARLEKGAKVADVGCGLGASTILMAQAFPQSRFFGFDYHDKSVALAKERAKKAGVKNAEFEVADAAAYPGKDYDLVAHFDCLHDMADPVGAAKQVRKTLKKDGTWMLVEPFANDTPEQNHNPVGRVYYGASTLICVPVSLAANGPAIGAQAGEARLGQIAKEAGFTRFRRATETPFNIVLEARP
jgi:SAM-dependent methyltransferase